ncbi:MAG TPA: hypothetical protein VGM64_09590 [Lacunisphaera sp.]
MIGVVCPAADRAESFRSNDRALSPIGEDGGWVIFSNTKYFLRSSKDGQYVFTPRGQEDPKRWTDLITLNFYPEITEGKSLAAKAIAWWEYFRSRRIFLMGLNYVPRVDQMNAASDSLYTLVAIRAKPYNDYDEFNFTAIRMTGGNGAASTYSHREYRTGPLSMERCIAWSGKNEPVVGEAWFAWDGAAIYARMLAARPSQAEAKKSARSKAIAEESPWTQPRG